jgi:amidase
MRGIRPATAPIVGHDQVQHAFAADALPVASVPAGQKLTVRTRSLHTDGGFDRSLDYRDLSIPLTGPIRLTGTRPGDRVRIDIDRVHIADRGALVTMPGRGAFGVELATSGLSTRITDGMVHFAAGIDVPVRPMIGKLGVAVPDSPPGSSTVGAHGGNMDCTDITAGSAVILTVLVDEAALYLGDLHACQGDGESSLTGVEVEGAVDLAWHPMPEIGLASPRPLVLTADRRVLTIGDGDTLAEAVELALQDMLALVQLAHGWSRERAAMFISIAADVGICQLVNPRLSAKVAVEVRHFAGTPCASWLGCRD